MNSQVAKMTRGRVVRPPRGESASEPAGGSSLKVSGPVASAQDRDPGQTSRGRKVKDLPPASGGAVHPDLKLLNDLVDEQMDNTRSRANAASNKTAVTYIACGDFLVLFVVNQNNQPRERRYVCQLVDVVDGA
jgi:hypothetical protein